jgi:hypothetical protein
MTGPDGVDRNYYVRQLKDWKFSAPIDFPHGLEVDASMFQPLHEVIETFTSADWRVVSFGTFIEPSPGTPAVTCSNDYACAHTRRRRSA